MSGESELMMNCTLCIQETNNVMTIKGRRLELVGHVVRMSDGRTIKKVCLGKPEGRIITGRPKLRWLDCTEKGGRKQERQLQGYHRDGGRG